LHKNYQRALFREKAAGRMRKMPFACGLLLAGFLFSGQILRFLANIMQFGWQIL